MPVKTAKELIREAMGDIPEGLSDNMTFDQMVDQLELWVNILKKHKDNAGKATVWTMRSVLDKLEPLLKDVAEV